MDLTVESCQGDKTPRLCRRKNNLINHPMTCCYFLSLKYRCIERLLAGSNGNTEIWASYLQIYCEAITDLLYQRSDTNFIPAGGQSVTSSFESGKTTPVGIAGMDAGATGMDSVGLVGGQQLRPGTPMNLMIREKTDGKGVYVEGLSRLVKFEQKTF